MDTGLSLKSGKCPKCGSNEIYTTCGLGKRGERVQFAISSMTWFLLDTYICTNCGQFEEYINDADLKNEKAITKIKETWNKVK